MNHSQENFLHVNRLAAVFDAHGLSRVLLCAICWAVAGLASPALAYPAEVLTSITLGWDPPESNLDGTPITDLAGHKVYVGTTSGNYDRIYDAGNHDSFIIPDLHKGMTHYFAVSAYNSALLEGPKSEEFVWRYNDADVDGITDSWEIDYFGSATGASASADPDGDGLTNLQEYILGSNPLLSSAKPELLLQPVNGQVQIRLEAPPAATGPHYEGLTRFATIEATTLAKNAETVWTPLSGYDRIVCGGQEVIVSIPSASNRSAIYRARFWLAPTL